MQQNKPVREVLSALAQTGMRKGGRHWCRMHMRPQKRESIGGVKENTGKYKNRICKEKCEKVCLHN